MLAGYVMDNTKHKAHYQVAIYLRSPHINLSASKRLILRVIADYIDMRLGKCMVKQSSLANECGISERQFRRNCDQLIYEKLLFRYTDGKLYTYELGEILTKKAHL